MQTCVHYKVRTALVAHTMGIRPVVPVIQQVLEDTP